MTTDQPVSPGFVKEVRDVLQAFYNPSELQKSGLIAMLGLGQERNSAGALRRIFREAIRALKPEENAPRHSTVWRVYYVLSSRYIEQLSQKEVADELGLSTRQVRRYERLAAILLANVLWKQRSVHTPVGSSPAPVLPFADAAPVGKVPPDAREQELSWIKSSNPIEIASVTAVVNSALKTISPLMRSSGGSIQYEAPDHLPPIAGQISSIKQALLEVLTAAVSIDRGGEVWVSAEKVQQHIRVRMRLISRQASSMIESSEMMAKIDIARQLAELSGGYLELQPLQAGGSLFDATLVLPAADQVTVLAIDDNVDALQLLQRFTSGSRYQLSVADNPELAFRLIEVSPPQIILLDVMMPGVDGWELLGRLREHPKTESVPVIVSTILLQEELALSLGAAGFLRKPFTQQALMTALDQQME